MAEETDPEPRKSSPHEKAGTRVAPVEVLRFKLATLGLAQIFTVVIAFAAAPFVALPFHALLPEGYWGPFLVASFPPHSGFFRRYDYGQASLERVRYPCCISTDGRLHC